MFNDVRARRKRGLNDGRDMALQPGGFECMSFHSSACKPEGLTRWKTVQYFNKQACHFFFSSEKQESNLLYPFILIRCQQQDKILA